MNQEEKLAGKKVATRKVAKFTIVKNFLWYQAYSGKKGPASGFWVGLALVFLAAFFAQNRLNFYLLEKLFNQKFTNFDNMWSVEFDKLEAAVKQNTEDIRSFLISTSTIMSQFNKMEGEIGANEEGLKKLTGSVDWTLRARGLRIVKLEDKLDIEGRPFNVASPVVITDDGIRMLRESGMCDLLSKYKPKLMEKFKKGNLSASPTICEVEIIAQSIIDNYSDFEEEDTKPVEDYMVKNPDGKMYNIWELAGYKLRDMVLEDLGIPLNKKLQENEPTQTEEKTPNPSN